MNESKKHTRIARMLARNVIVIDVTEKDIELIKQNKLELERLKSTLEYTVYRVKR